MTFRSQELAGRRRNIRLKGKSLLRKKRRHKKETREHWFRIGLIASILIAMVVYVTSASSQDDKKWGFGIIGTIVGYAIRGPL